MRILFTFDEHFPADFDAYSMLNIFSVTGTQLCTNYHMIFCITKNMHFSQQEFSNMASDWLAAQQPANHKPG